MTPVQCLVLLCSLFQSSADLKGFENVDCDSRYERHLQGICVDDEAIYWSFTTQMVKTDRQGKVIKAVPAVSHHGDLCYHDGKVYVAVNLGKFNDPEKRSDNWIYVYDAKDLTLASKHEVPDVVYGAGGMAYHDARFIVIGGLPEGFEENYVYEYDSEFRLVKKHVIKSGYTRLGIQTATYADGHWYFGCYGNVLLVTDTDFKLKGRYDYNCALGIEALPNGLFLSAGGKCDKEKGCVGWAKLAEADAKAGLKLKD